VGIQANVKPGRIRAYAVGEGPAVRRRTDELPIWATPKAMDIVSRLLRQPGSFEGFLAGCVLVAVGDLAVAHLVVQVGATFDLYVALPTSTDSYTAANTFSPSP
jgi:hypothetical protein